MVKGLMIIPEGIRVRGCKDKGFPDEVTKIVNLDEMIEYANNNSLGIIYLYSAFGVRFVDDVFEYNTIHMSKLNKREFLFWSYIMARQILDVCINFNTNQVYLMSKLINRYKVILEILEKDGIILNLPIIGMSDKLVKETLTK